MSSKLNKCSRKDEGKIYGIKAEETTGFQVDYIESTRSTSMTVTKSKKFEESLEKCHYGNDGVKWSKRIIFFKGNQNDSEQKNCNCIPKLWRTHRTTDLNGKQKKRCNRLSGLKIRSLLLHLKVSVQSDMLKWIWYISDHEEAIRYMQRWTFS